MKFHSLLLLVVVLYYVPAWGQNTVKVEEKSITYSENSALANTLFYRTTDLGENDYNHLSPEQPGNINIRFNRPVTFQKTTEKGNYSFGGYAEANTQYFVTDGEVDGLQFQFRRIHFIAQSVMLRQRLHFIADVEFNPISMEFNLTEAALNIRFHKTFNLRGGVILPPLGYFNQNGDSPTSDFIDWPLSSTTIIPSRWSEVGFGLNGTVRLGSHAGLTYEMYAVNGLQEGIVDNDLPRTAINLGKSGNLLGADNNDKLAYTGRLGVYLKGLAEIGFSYYRGVYNITEVDETEVDVPRELSIMAVDGRIKFQKLSIIGEAVLANINVHDGLEQLFGEKQMGYHVEASYPIVQNIRLLGQNGNCLDLAVRYEFVDYNIGSIEQTETKIFDDITGIRGGLALRFGELAVLKGNYSYFWENDILGNLSKTGGIQVGFATYF